MWKIRKREEIFQNLGRESEENFLPNFLRLTRGKRRRGQGKRGSSGEKLRGGTRNSAIVKSLGCLRCRSGPVFWARVSPTGKRQEQRRKQWWRGGERVTGFLEEFTAPINTCTWERARNRARWCNTSQVDRACQSALRLFACSWSTARGRNGPIRDGIRFYDDRYTYLFHSVISRKRIFRLRFVVIIPIRSNYVKCFSNKWKRTSKNSLW